MKNKILVFFSTLIFVFLLSFNAKVHAQEKFTLSAGVTLPVPLVNSNYNSLLGYKIEFLKNFKILKNTKLSTGLGFQYGEHAMKNEVAWLTMEDGKLNVFPIR